MWSDANLENGGNAGAAASEKAAASLLAEAQAAQAAAEQAAESASADAVTAAGYAGAAEFSLGIDPTTGRLGLFKNTTTTEATT